MSDNSPKIIKAIKKSSKKMSISTRKRVFDELDKYWSLFVRARDNRCMLCGKCVDMPQKLQAHHWIVSRGKSLKYRCDPRNGIALCYGCHIHQVHTNPTVDMLNRLKESAIVAGIATEDDIQEIISRSAKTSYISVPELEDMLAKLKADYESLPQAGGLRADLPLSRVNMLNVDDLF